MKDGWEGQMGRRRGEGDEQGRGSEKWEERGREGEGNTALQ